MHKTNTNWKKQLDKYKKFDLELFCVEAVIIRFKKPPGEICTGRLPTF
jgi:hypothetical protein